MGLRLPYLRREALEVDEIRCMPCEDFLRWVVLRKGLP